MPSALLTGMVAAREILNDLYGTRKPKPFEDLPRLLKQSADTFLDLYRNFKIASTAADG